MMLGRLQSDCEYYLNYGNRCIGRLYHLDEKKQIAAMKKLWNELPDEGKPEWLTWEQILEYEKEMYALQNKNTIKIFSKENDYEFNKRTKRTIRIYRNRSR